MIVIVGAGIGGLTAAVALQQRGFDAHVYEAADNLAPVGHGIWVPTNALLALDHLGLADTVAERGVVLDRVELRDREQGLLQAVDMVAAARHYGRATVSIRRAVLQQILTEALEPGTLHLGSRCAAVEYPDDASGWPTVVFADDRRVAAPLVIGADGIRSVVRESVNPGVELRYAGQTCFRGVAKMTLPESLRKTVWEVWDGNHRFGFSAVDEESVYWFAPVSDVRQSAPVDRRADIHGLDWTMIDAYKSFPDPIPTVIESTAKDDISRHDLIDFRPTRPWHRGRVLLLGDAAHAMTPNLGQGGAQAIEDGLVIAAILEEAGRGERKMLDAWDWPAVSMVLERFERTRSKRVAPIVTTAWRVGKLAHQSGRFVRRVRNTVMRSAPSFVTGRQMDSLYAFSLPDNSSH